MIDKFRGDYYFLSNFYPASVLYEGILYPSNEAAFQSAKTLDRNVRLQFVRLTPKEAKRKGRKVALREDWEYGKFYIMYQIVKAKFIQHTDLKEKLLATGEEELVEGNSWNDRIWGVCRGRGKNKLGKILMAVRKELKESER